MWCVAVLLAMTCAVAQGQIGSSFFGMGVTTSSDLPQVSYGIMSHPPLAWTAIEGVSRGSFDFTTTDQYVEAAPKDSNGVAQVDLVLGWTPGWAVAKQTDCSTQSSGMVICTGPPDNMKDWTDFITQLVAHYNGVTAPHIKYYEIWNEANTIAFWTGSVAQMIALGKEAYPILKQDKYSQVLTPSVVWSVGAPFITAYLKGGGSLYADGMTFHGYPSKTWVGINSPVALPESTQSTNAAIQTMVSAYRVVADANGMKGKPLMSTEGGWGVDGVTDQDMQAAWITQYEILQAGLAAKDDLLFATWFAWGQGASGTIETPQGLPTEAGYAYQELNKWLVGKTATPCVSSGLTENLWSCAVGTNLIVWDASQVCSKGVCTTSLYKVPKGYTKYVDLTGTTYEISSEIGLGVKPVMLEPK